MSNRLNELLGQLEGFHEEDDDKYDEIPGFTGKVHALTDSAAFIELEDKSEWFPLSQLRTLNGDLFATKWVLDRKGLL